MGWDGGMGWDGDGDGMDMGMGMVTACKIPHSRLCHT